jgi:hypothetical protein
MAGFLCRAGWCYSFGSDRRVLHRPVFLPSRRVFRLLYVSVLIARGAYGMLPLQPVYAFKMATTTACTAWLFILMDHYSHLGMIPLTCDMKYTYPPCDVMFYCNLSVIWPVLPACGIYERGEPSWTCTNTLNKSMRSIFIPTGTYFLFLPHLVVGAIVNICLILHYLQISSCHCKRRPLCAPLGFEKTCCILFDSSPFEFNLKRSLSGAHTRLPPFFLSSDALLSRLTWFCLFCTSLVQPELGSFLMTSSYDKTCKIFSCADWSLTHTLSGHEDKIMRAEIAPSTQYTSSCIGPCFLSDRFLNTLYVRSRNRFTVHCFSVLGSNMEIVARQKVKYRYSK